MAQKISHAAHGVEHQSITLDHHRRAKPACLPGQSGFKVEGLEIASEQGIEVRQHRPAPSHRKDLAGRRCKFKHGGAAVQDSFMNCV